jgi:hypothetical protein
MAGDQHCAFSRNGLRGMRFLDRSNRKCLAFPIVEPRIVQHQRLAAGDSIVTPVKVLSVRSKVVLANL